MLAGLEAAVRAGLAGTGAALAPLKVRRLLGAGGGFRALAMVSRTLSGAMPETLELAPTQALVERIPGMRGIYAGRLRNAHQVEALTANLISVNCRYKAHAGLRVTDV